MATLTRNCIYAQSVLTLSGLICAKHGRVTQQFCKLNCCDCEKKNHNRGHVTLWCTVCGGEHITGRCHHHTKKPAVVVALPPAPVVAVHDPAWPLSVCVLARLRQDGEKGVGDTLHRVFKSTGIDLAVRAAVRLLGVSCNCAKRQASLNQKYPYPPPPGCCD